MSAELEPVGDVGAAAAAGGDEMGTPASISSFKEIQSMKWQSLSTKTEFSERVGHALITSAKSKTVYMIGGGNHEGDIAEIWSVSYDKPMDGIAWEPVEIKNFEGRYEFAATLSPAEDKIWIFGGADCKQPRNDVCYLDLESKELITKFAMNKEIALKTKEDDETKDFEVPYPRTQGGNSCYLQIGEKSYLAAYGGGVKGEHAIPDGHLYLFDVDSGEWHRIAVTGDTPGVRQGHVMTSVGTKVFLHGGMHEFTIYDDLYSIDLNNFETNPPSWVRISSEIHPKGRAAQGIVRNGSDIYVFGGLGPEGALGDLWKFSTESLEWTELKANQFPSPRLDAAVTLVDLGEGSDERGSSKKILLVHGGMNTEGSLFKDFWALALP